MADKNGRRGANIISLVFTLAVLLVALDVSSGDFQTRINKISTDLNKALSEVFAEGLTIDYTDVKINATYLSDNSFNPRGMAGLYNITDKFMDAVIKDILPKDLLDINNNGDPVLNENADYNEILKHYAGSIALLTFIALFAVLMPLCGFCFCCCRCCCNNCGSRSKPFDKKNDLCKKIIYASLLICLGTLLLFGVVCAFVSNQHMQDGTDELVTNLRTSLIDSKTYINTTRSQINILLVTNYYQFSDAVVTTIENSATVVSDKLQEFSKATSMLRMVEIVDSLEDIKNNFTEIKEGTNKMRVSASQLSDAFRKLRRDLLSALLECKVVCDPIKKEYITKLEIDIDFNSIPDVTEQIDSLKGFDELAVEMQKGKAELDKMKQKIQDAVDTNVGDVKKTIDDAGEEIKKNMLDVTQVLIDMTHLVDDASGSYLRDLDDNLREYSKYRYYVGLGVSSILLLISICIALGLICGVCGKRPDSFGDDCCNKGAGSRFLIIGVGIMFLTSIILAVVAFAYIVVGIPVQRAFCDTLENPNEPNEAMRLINKWVSNQDVGIKLDISQVLKNCRQNMSAYEVFDLKQKFNLEEVPEYIRTYKIEEMVKQLQDKIANTNLGDINLLPGGDGQLVNFSKIPIDDNQFEKIILELNVTFSIIDLKKFNEELLKVVNLLESRKDPHLKDMIQSLRNSILHVEAYDLKILTPMTVIAQNIIEKVSYMREALKFNRNSFEEAILGLLDEIKLAQAALESSTGPDSALAKAAKAFAEQILEEVKSFLDRIVAKFYEVGTCEPLNLIFDATLTSTCDKILLPLNGHWFGILWSIFLFIPIIIVSVKLASLYQKYDPYPGSMIEAEYLYDAYADRENIPLARGKPGKKKHKKKSRGGRGYMPDNMETGVHAGRDYPGASHHHPDTRYADMAPKHWEDFPNGGPPQYQRAPTEYERPPPYYYPGSGDQN